MAPNVVKAMNQKTEEIRTKTVYYQLKKLKILNFLTYFIFKKEPDEVFNAEKEELSYSQQQNIK